MSETIVNKVAQSALITFDLEEHIPKGTRTLIDLAQWLEGGLLLREKPFREELKGHDWSQYQDHHIALDCNSDAILPAWASLLVAAYLQPYAQTLVLGTLFDLEQKLFRDCVREIELAPYQNKPIIIKGCSDPNIPKDAYIQLIQRLQGVAKSLFYGEACSSVPLWKAKKIQ
jgi:hypothetical protein